MTGSEFVRSRPLDMPVPQVLDEAKAMGLTIRSGLVHSVRSVMRRNAGAPKGGARVKGSLVAGGITDRVLAFLRRWMAQHKGPPTRNVIAKAVGTSARQVSQALGFLRAHGVVDFTPRDISTLKLVRGDRRAPVPADEILDELVIPPHLRKQHSASNGHAAPPSFAGLLPGHTESGEDYKDALKRDLARLVDDLEAKIAAARSLMALLG